MPLVPRHLRTPALRGFAVCNLPAKNSFAPLRKSHIVGTRIELSRRSGQSTSCAVKALHSVWILALVLLLGTGSASAAGVRIRDVAMIAGARDNQLVGYGLVAGLAGEGDKDPL